MRTQVFAVHWKPGWHWALSVQLVGQPPPLQKYGAQVRPVGGWHTPRPLQVRALVSVNALAQLEAAQVVFIGCNVQAPAPLQPPARPQVVGASATHWLRGSMPAGTMVHVPSAPATLQALHISPHWLSQQYPSTQKLLAH
jgi:hypothetical protein